MHFDPKIGFVQKSITAIYTGYYNCNFVRGNVTQEVSIHLNVIRK